MSLFEENMTEEQKIKYMFRHMLMTNTEETVEANVEFLYSLLCEKGVTL